MVWVNREYKKNGGNDEKENTNSITFIFTY